MAFRSILFAGTGAPADIEDRPAPDFFADLNIDQIVESVMAGESDYDLRPFFNVALTDADEVLYRQEVFRDLETDAVHGIAERFAATMRQMRSHLRLTSKLHYRYQKQRWYLQAIAVYCEAITGLASDLAASDLASRGLIALRDHVSEYARSDAVLALGNQARQLIDELATVRYDLLIRGSKITVARYDQEVDYSHQVREVFERFRQGTGKDHRAKLSSAADMDHVEAGILGLVAKVYPELFGALDAFCSRHQNFVDPTVGRFDRELQFYLAYLAHLAPLRQAGLATCYPQVSADSKQVRAEETFDLALAAKLTRDKAPVVSNDLHLDGPERILVVSGPNQGGKTTLARTFGQLHYLASLGCPVPGRDVRMWLPDRIFTHFEREEDLDTLAGKLEDELQRIHAILERATASSVIILNEIFTSTTLQDALQLSTAVLERITDIDALCLCVTFIDELSTLNAKTVSMVSTVVPENLAVRTFKLVRKPAAGRAYASAIAEKYGLTYDSLKGRITS